MLKKTKKIEYDRLNSRQQENFNFQKASAILAEYGYNCLRLSDDWNGADFIAMHIDGSHLKVQLKARLSTSPKYVGKQIHIMFEYKLTKTWYIYPHDDLNDYNIKYHPDTTFTERGHSRGRLSKENLAWLEPYIIEN